MLLFGPKNDVISKASHADFSVSFRWASSRAHGPSAGSAEANGLPEAYGPRHGTPKVYGPRGHCLPCPPLGGPGPELSGQPSIK